MSERITHDGIVTKVEPGVVTVRIQSTSACGSCHAKGLCQMSEKTDKDVVVKTRKSQEYTVGEAVDVFLTSGMGLKAVLYAYVLSLAAGALFFFLGSLFTSNQGVWGLCAILGIALYFGILKLVSKRINAKFSFGIAHRIPSERGTNA